MNLKKELILFACSACLLSGASGAISYKEIWEEEQGGYPGSTESSGGRGDCLGSNLSFKLTRQSWEAGFLEWKVTDIPKAHVFRVTLNVPNSPAPAIVDEHIKIEKPGIYKVPIPKGKVAVGRYRWTVQAICNARKPSHNQVAWTFIDVDEGTAMNLSLSPSLKVD